jgi:hypothetical protein
METYCKGQWKHTVNIPKRTNHHEIRKDKIISNNNIASPQKKPAGHDHWSKHTESFAFLAHDTTNRKQRGN